MNYRDFVVQIGAGGQGNTYPVWVLQSPAGEGKGTFRAPFPAPAGGLFDAARGVQILTAPKGAPTGREMGISLFSALFSGEVASLYQRSLGQLEETESLRIKIKLDLELPDALWLSSLPWELLCSPGESDFLALSRRRSIVRYLDVPRQHRRLPALPDPLRALAVMASPEELPSLQIDREKGNLEEAASRNSRLQLTFLQPASVDALRQALVGGEYHILHFMGHGQMDPASGEGVIYLQAEDGGCLAVSGQALAVKLHDVRSLRLVVLNACQSADPGADPLGNPFGGLAAALVKAGLPAVLAMQEPISDAAAVAFAAAFYRRLAVGEPVDAAVTEGRQAIHSDNPQSLEWAVPVLHMRVPDGRLFESSKLPAQRPRRRWRGWALAAAAAFALLLAGWHASIGATMHDWFYTLGIPWPAGVPALEKVPLGQFQMGRYEVSNRQFLPFVLANPGWRRGKVPDAFQDGDYLRHWIDWDEYPPELADHPVTHVSWAAAQAFCEWAGGSLPSVGQWQMAAHAGQHPFPWGPDPYLTDKGSRLNYCDAGCDRGHRGLPDSDNYPETAPVNAYPDGQTREGVFNLSGNVWEWCLDASASERKHMGGSYLWRADECSTDVVNFDEAVTCAPDGGFRCLWQEGSR